MHDDRQPCEFCDPAAMLSGAEDCDGKLMSAGGWWFCTRPKGHSGPHVACGAVMHDFRRWNDDTPEAA